MQNLKKQLSNLGLSENQAQSYITLLKLGTATASQISKESGVTRTTVYDNLLVLQNQHLISMTTVNDKTVFVAESPDVIKELAEKRYNSTIDLISELHEIFNSENSKPTIKIYPPNQGFERMHELSIIGNRSFRTRFLGDINTLIAYKGNSYIKDYVEKRIEIGIRNQVLTISNVLEKKEMYSHTINRQKLREIKYLPSLNQMKTCLFCYDDTVWILPTTKQGYVIMINNAEFSTTFNNIFESLWSAGQELEHS
jgi:sugar-specific transcriptional regulator TrmB